MLKNLSRNFSHIIKKMRGQGRLSEENIAEALSEIRLALLDADVALPVVEQFLGAVKEQAYGVEIVGKINPGQAFVNIVHRELTAVMGGDSAELQLKKSPTVILACGLQGVGKTTNLAKIANILKTKNKKRVMLGSTDVRRPAALEQLAILAESISVPCIDSPEKTDAVARAADILKTARRQLADVVLVDTAGRLALDNEMMEEIRQLSKLLSPAETLFFVDAMQGQDAVNVAREFHQALNITGIVLTKFDGDVRGGAALSAKTITGAPIKFVGVGEKIADMQTFHPARFASRILGMGDLEGLAEQAAADPSTIRMLGKTLHKPNSFDLNDQLKQMQQMRKMGGLAAMADKLPSSISDKISDADAGDKQIEKLEAIICSMTPGERAIPDVIKASRKRRIATGAGVEVNLVNQLLTQHNQMRKMMKRFSKNPAEIMRLMRGM